MTLSTLVTFALCVVIGIALGQAGLTIHNWQTHVIVLSVAAIRFIDRECAKP